LGCDGSLIYWYASRRSKVAESSWLHRVYSYARLVLWEHQNRTLPKALIEEKWRETHKANARALAPFLFDMNERPPLAPLLDALACFQALLVSNDFLSLSYAPLPQGCCKRGDGGEGSVDGKPSADNEVGAVLDLDNINKCSEAPLVQRQGCASL
jgi:hypothetical protein